MKNNNNQQELTFITGNLAKFEQLVRHMSYPITHINMEIEEIQSLDPRKVVEHKTKEAYRKTKKPVLVEDTSLIFHALGNLPGPLIKWFLKELGNEGLCKLLNGYPDRTATAMVTFGLYDGKTMKIFEHKIEGSIAKIPKGKAGFGWDPIFTPKGYTKTWAQLFDGEHENIRKPLVQKIERYLKNGQQI
ncbi:non-canonical purine NTP pyrophosphatase [Candidatus Daviesbacteria bacterium]|nr:non-canonical purine NTP pyrophosphatase [Candidatus Daviesbacteria bacterium]